MRDAGYSISFDKRPEPYGSYIAVGYYIMSMKLEAQKGPGDRTTIKGRGPPSRIGKQCFVGNESGRVGAVIRSYNLILPEMASRSLSSTAYGFEVVSLVEESLVEASSSVSRASAIASVAAADESGFGDDAAAASGASSGECEGIL